MDRGQSGAELFDDVVFVPELKSGIAVYPGQPVLDTLRAGIG